MSQLLENTYNAYNRFLEGELNEYDLMSLIEDEIISGEILESMLVESDDDNNPHYYSDLGLAYRNYDLADFGDEKIVGKRPWNVSAIRTDLQGNSKKYYKHVLKHAKSNPMDLRKAKELSSAMKKRNKNLLDWHEKSAKDREEKAKKSKHFLAKAWHNYKKNKYLKLSKKIKHDIDFYGDMEDYYDKSMNSDTVRLVR